ncbi:MAG: DM13 domain-containing protein [Pseudonocardia sp.]
MPAPTSPRRALLRRPVTWMVLGLGAIALVVVLLVFEPWKLVVNETVDEALPGYSAAPAAGAPVSPGIAVGEPPVGPVVLAGGELITHEHATTGTVQVLALPDGSRVLRLENLDTSNGPDLKVWITDAPVIPGSDGWFVFDDGAYVDLGDLLGNKGSSNYVLPADVDLSRLTSVSIWCARFDVSFGAAALEPVTP